MWWISTYAGGPLSSIIVVVLYRRGAGSPLGVVVAPVFPVLSLPLAGGGLLGLWAWTRCPFEPLIILILLTLTLRPDLKPFYKHYNTQEYIKVG